MASAAHTSATRAAWSDRLFAASPVAPIWVGAGIGVGLLALFVLLCAKLGRLSSVLAGDVGALEGSALAPGLRGASPVDLVAWKTFVDSVSDRPFDANMRLRFLLYLAIALASWLGGAVVERLLGAALG